MQFNNNKSCSWVKIVSVLCKGLFKVFTINNNYNLVNWTFYVIVTICEIHLFPSFFPSIYISIIWCLCFETSKPRTIANFLHTRTVLIYNHVSLHAEFLCKGENQKLLLDIVSVSKVESFPRPPLPATSFDIRVLNSFRSRTRFRLQCPLSNHKITGPVCEFGVRLAFPSIHLFSAIAILSSTLSLCILLVCCRYINYRLVFIHLCYSLTRWILTSFCSSMISSYRHRVLVSKMWFIFEDHLNLKP